MYPNIIPIGYEYAYSGTYQFTTTHEQDEDYRKYLVRKLAEVMPFQPETHSYEAYPVDISMDDVEGDVVAGISAVIERDVLVIDMLWVGEPLRGQGVEQRLVQMAEAVAQERGCYRARVRTTDAVAFYVDLGYVITGTIQEVPVNGATLPVTELMRRAVYWLTKELN